MGTLIGGVIVDVAGLQPNAEPGTVPAEVLATLGWFYGPGIAFAGLVAWWSARRVRLSRQQHAIIREQLAQAAGSAV